MANIINISGTEIKDRGIQKLAEYVSANLTDEFTLVIGCKPSIYDVDAVLIGGGNIYDIECKDWKGNVKGGSYGWWQKDDGQIIENPLQQARNNAVALGKWLRDNIRAARDAVWVKGLVVFTHDDIDLNLNIDDKSNTAISLFHLTDLKGHIDKQKGKMKKELEGIVLRFFSRFGEEDKMKKMSWIEKVLSFLSILTLIITIVLGFLSFNYSDSFVFSFILLGIIFITLTSLSFKGRTKRNHFHDKLRNEYDPYEDFSTDPYNIYNTYDKP